MSKEETIANYKAKLKELDKNSPGDSNKYQYLSDIINELERKPVSNIKLHVDVGDACVSCT